MGKSHDNFFTIYFCVHRFIDRVPSLPKPTLQTVNFWIYSKFAKQTNARFGKCQLLSTNKTFTKFWVLLKLDLKTFLAILEVGKIVILGKSKYV